MTRLLFVFVVLAACGKNNEPPPPTSGSPSGKPESGPSHHPTQPTNGGALSGDETARRLYGTLCTQCHGPDGTANTPTGQMLNPHPRNYTDPAWQASVTDDELRKVIVGGGVAVGKSNLMAPNPDLADKPDVVDGLIKIIRGFKK